MRTYLQPAFVICVLVLLLSGVVMSKFHIEQEPWPLKKPLSLLDEDGLGAYHVVKKLTIEDEDVLTQLGTEDYIQWFLEDSEVLNDSPVRNVMLFITYYPLADRVPHVPEECYVGAGHQLLASEAIEYVLARGQSEELIEGRHLVFQKTGANHWGLDEKFSAFYLFSVNGRYAASRNSTRLALYKSTLSMHCYFSKVEWSFLTGSGTSSYLDEDEARKAGEKLLAVILPILESKHWPKEAIEQGGEQLLDESAIID
ncbi:MAG TPA: exosortase-associated EpsI family protein [Sedimentisphaerales bacterium]|nr:exosortase-associated EpsI family protein [Sedimentisphaerales bacterium]